MICVNEIIDRVYLHRHEGCLCLAERLTFDKLLRLSEPKRIARSNTVRGPALELEQTQDGLYYYFNFKSFPSTTGLRHNGYIKFFKPRGLMNRVNRQAGNPLNQKPLQNVECLVDCECPDFKYRWAWANAQHQSSRTGDTSLNQAINRAPRITNPSGRPGLCKHLIATRDYIYDQISSFEGEGDIATKMDKMTKHATKRWINFPAEMAKAKARDQKFAKARGERSRGILRTTVEEPAFEPPPGPETPPESGEDILRAHRDANRAATHRVGEPPAEEEEEIELPPPAPIPPRRRAGRRPPPPPPAPPARRAGRRPTPPPAPPARRRAPPTTRRRARPPTPLPPPRWLTRNISHESVDKVTPMKTTKSLTESLKLVTELMEEPSPMPSAPSSGAPVPPPGAADVPAPESEGSEALTLLRDMRDLLQKLVGDGDEGSEEMGPPEEDGTLGGMEGEPESEEGDLGTPPRLAPKVDRGI